MKKSEKYNYVKICIRILHSYPLEFVYQTTNVLNI